MRNHTEIFWLKAFPSENSLAKIRSIRLDKKDFIKFCDGYFDEITNLEDFDFYNFLLDKELHKNILIYDIFYRTLTGANPFLIIFNKTDVVI